MSSMDPTEPLPDPQILTFDTAKDMDSYEPSPKDSLQISQERQDIVDAITSLYSGSASKDNLEIYTPNAIYDDPLNHCDNKYKIAGQWHGIPKFMTSSKTLKTEVVSSTPTDLVFKLRQEYSPRLASTKAIDSLVSLRIEKDENENERVSYHKDTWNDKDYNYQGIAMLLKRLNGDYLTNITQPPKT